MTIDQMFQNVKSSGSDICEHVETLKRYSSECKSVVELGVRTGHSTVALLSGRPEMMRSYDIALTGEAENIKKQATAEGINFDLIQADDLAIEIPECDLLFIDTLHTSEQLSRELERHESKAKKYIILHDTVTFGMFGELPGTFGLLFAVIEFLRVNNFRLIEHFTNNNGLTVLERV